jgi:hypothetical protein
MFGDIVASQEPLVHSSLSEHCAPFAASAMHVSIVCPLANPQKYPSTQLPPHAVLARQTSNN